MVINAVKLKEVKDHANRPKVFIVSQNVEEGKLSVVLEERNVNLDSFISVSHLIKLNELFLLACKVVKEGLTSGCNCVS